MAGIGDEGIETSKLGAALFAFGFFLAIAIIIFTTGKTIANNGSDKVQKQLEILQLSEFTDYDQAVVLGNKLRAAYDAFEGKPYAVIVGTRNLIDCQSISGIEFTGDSDDLDMLIETDITTTNSEGKTNATVYGMNYNALLPKDTELEMKNGSFITTSSFAVDDKTGAIKFNNDIANTKKQGRTEYIASGAKFQSNLIKDTTGEIVGVFFYQVASNN
ncbi:hypothetical protein acsn021_06580 [Anaerocolumna cellulosilytica]|uniref:Uncharacterized protein n=1 Tax=Anaerocolumna cellulosilytica TaxID=433286 RepID=A0A6S6QVH7_9FIRM|nr:hypothetical protein [Anaerocolumna cellulosilytica]MBB5197687.1 hypothetical protein [Anaerocolumna cellulosilytica]BCJ93089.1 hypothetical protein acsn021_06580 [Anaerocolumna cellulosilytica]